MRLENKVAIITGGGTGIGKETALLFAKEGAKIVITDINKESGSQAVKDIQANGGEALFIQHDVSNEDDWKRVANETIKTFGKVDILFNNAGIYIIKPLAEIELADWNRLMSINVTGVFLGMKHIMPLMAKQNKVSVINASSIAGLTGAPGHVLYGASKGAVRIMTKDAAMEYAPYGVRVNSIHPGYIDTGMADYASEVSGSSKEELGKSLFPLGHLGSVKDVANTVLFLASDESAYSTGAEFVIDGGASGIGEATVRLFAEEGAKVVIADFSDRGKSISEELNAKGHDTLFVKTDVTNEDQIKQMINETVNKYGKLDIMYANAGIADDAPAHELSYERWKRTIDINLSGVFLSDKYSIEQFLKQGTGGVIVNAGSIHSFVSLPNPTAYSSAKGGVKLLTQNLCTAYAKDGIRINAVCPGYIDTPLLSEVNPEQKEFLVSLHPQGRLGKPEEVAKAVLFLASDDSSFVNGTTLLVDGGYTAH